MHNVLLLIGAGLDDGSWPGGWELDSSSGYKPGRGFPRNGDADRRTLALWLRCKSTDSLLALAIDRQHTGPLDFYSVVPGAQVVGECWQTSLRDQPKPSRSRRRDSSQNGDGKH